MAGRTHYVIFKGENDSRYSITECGNSGVRQAFMSEGIVSGDGSVLLELSRIAPENASIQAYVEENAGCLIFGD
jgi:hypothetical protein